MKTRWYPGDITDVEVEPARAIDPEATLYLPSRNWVLVMSAKTLRAVADWNDDTIAFVCVEAIREDPSATNWERVALHVFFVKRERMIKAGFQEGPILGSDRYRLRDIATDPEYSADGRLVKE